MAVKPWKGAIRAPTGWKQPPKNYDEAPQVSVEPDWVYGYRGSMDKNNLKCMNDGSLCYMAAGLGVRLEADGSEQSFFQQHTDDITCIAFSPDGQHVATGENGRAPYVYVWDSANMQQKFALKGNGIIRSVMCVAYSPSGKSLGIIAQDDDHNIAVYSTESG